MKPAVSAPLLFAILLESGVANAVEFPGKVVGVDMMFRQGDLLTVGLRAGYLWRLPTTEYAGLGMAATSAFGIGGLSAAGGPIAMLHCRHAFGCTSVSLDAKVLRQMLMSSWEHVTHLGSEVGLGLYVFKFTAAAYRSLNGDSSTNLSFGAGIQMLF